MPLFGHKNNAPVEPTPNTARTRHSTSSSDASASGSRGLFGSRRRSSSSDMHNPQRSNTTGKRTSGGLFNRHSAEDPSIVDARQRVAQAERAEQEADRALVQARAAVRDARAHVKVLEQEAAEEARLAKIKQQNAKDISKRAKPLGRHDRY
ncbi:hypothetical protein KCU88_g4561, partial [Aureobasidium melanogenum]